MELYQLTIHELLDRLRAGETTSEEITASVFGRIDAVEKEVHAYITLMRETAMAEAARADELIRKGEIGALTGIPIALKDICCTKGVRTTCGSRILENFIPPYDATVVEKLRAAGAVFTGKTNMDEFAMGSSTENSAFGVDQEPLGSRTDSRRLERRLGGGGRGGRMHRCARLGHRRLHPPARGPLRRRRAEADLRPGLPLRPDRLRLVARPDRPLHEGRGGLRDHAERASPATTRGSRPRCRRRSPITGSSWAGGSQGGRSGSRRSTSSPGSTRRSRRPSAKRSGPSRRRGRTASRSRFPTPSTASPSTTSSPRRRPAPTSPATTA